MIVKQNRLVIGKIVGVHGIKGFVKIISFTENKKELFNYSQYYIKNEQFKKLTFHFTNKQNLICSLPHCNNRNKAITYLNQEIEIDKSALPKLKARELYQHSLIGLEAKNVKGDIFGKIVQFHDFGGGLLIEVDKNGQVFYLPIDPKFINDVNIEKKNVVLNLPIDFLNSNHS